MPQVEISAEARAYILDRGRIIAVEKEIGTG